MTALTPVLPLLSLHAVSVAGSGRSTSTGQGGLQVNCEVSAYGPLTFNWQKLRGHIKGCYEPAAANSPWHGAISTKNTASSKSSWHARV